MESLIYNNFSNLIVCRVCGVQILSSVKVTKLLLIELFKFMI